MKYTKITCEIPGSFIYKICAQNLINKNKIN